MPNVQVTNAGLYYVIVSNSLGSVTSQTARLTVWQIDYGDAPDPTYPSFLANNGAGHIVTNLIYLGATVDFDPDGQVDSTATGDDNDGRNDDDGVVFLSSLLVGQRVPVQLTVSRLGYLQGWIDFDRNGSWAEAGEQIFTNQLLSLGTTNLELVVPATAVPGPSFARFRFSSEQDLSFTGLASDGEVEDYLVPIEAAVDVGLGLVDGPDPVSLGSNLVYTLVVSNAGPSQATGVALVDLLPEGVSLTGLSTTQGSCTNEAGLITCGLGMLAPGAWARVELTVLVQSTGWVTNLAQVSAQETDLDPANNAAEAATLLTDRPILVQEPQSLIVTNGATATFTVQAVGIGPLSYQWEFKGTDLAGQTGTVLVIGPVEAGNYGEYRVRVSNPNGTVVSGLAQLIQATAPLVVTLPAEGLSSTGAVVRGSVVANGLASWAWFEWGTTTNYGFRTAEQAAGSGGVTVAVQAALGGLSGGLTYHYRAVASNALGTVFGEDLTWRWDGTAPLITSQVLLPEGSVRIGFAGTAKQVYVVQGSTNLATWTVLGPASEQGGGAFEFLDNTAAPFRSRFYRVLGP